MTTLTHAVSQPSDFLSRRCFYFQAQHENCSLCVLYGLLSQPCPVWVDTLLSIGPQDLFVMCNYAALFYPRLAFNLACCSRRHTQFLLCNRQHVLNRTSFGFSLCLYLSVLMLWQMKEASFIIECMNEAFVEPFSSLLIAACVGSSSIFGSSVEGG